MSLLIQEPPLQVLPTLAARIGLNEALFLQQLHYWLIRSKVERDGRQWVVQSIPFWLEQFPFWSERTIKRTVKSVRDLGLVEVRQLSAGGNRTNWYTIRYEHPAMEARGQVGLMHGANVASPSGQSGPFSNKEVIETKDREKSLLGDSPEPTKPAPPKSWRDDPDFCAAWDIYPKRSGSNPPGVAWKAWRARLKERDDDGNKITAAMMRDGAARYAAWAQSVGKVGTEYVMQARRFFGPSLLFLEEWEEMSHEASRKPDAGHARGDEIGDRWLRERGSPPRRNSPCH